MRLLPCYYVRAEEAGMNARRTAILLGHALVGSALCAATMSIGQATDNRVESENVKAK